MDPAAAERLRTFNLAAIATRLEALAALWARLCIEHLPVRDRTLASLQEEYGELFAALPPSSPAEIATILQAYCRGLRLREGRVSASQRRFLADALGLRQREATTTDFSFGILAPDDTHRYLRPIYKAEGSLVQGISVAAVLYVCSHRRLGARFPTFTEPLRDTLAQPQVHREMVDTEGCIGLGAMLSKHSEWIAGLVADPGEPPEDAVVGYAGDYRDALSEGALEPAAAELGDEDQA